MNELQNVTEAQIDNANSDFVAVPYSELTEIQRVIVDYRALNGLITDVDGGIDKKPVRWLADQLGISRKNVYDQINAIPNFWDHVAERRKALGSQSRLAKVHDAWYLKAAKGEFQHMQLYLANFDPTFRMPTEKHQVDATGSLLDVLERARQTHREFIEGEVVRDDADKQLNV